MRGIAIPGKTVTCLLVAVITMTTVHAGPPGIGWADSTVFIYHANQVPPGSAHVRPGIGWADSTVFIYHADQVPPGSAHVRPGIGWADSTVFIYHANQVPPGSAHVRPGIGWADSATLRIDASGIHRGWADSPLFSVDSGQGDWYVLTSVAYNPDTEQLTIAAHAVDRNTGQQKTTGSASYRLEDATTGNLTFSAGRWRGTVHLSGVCLLPRTHSVQVTIGTKHRTAYYTVTDDSGTASGTVVDAQGATIADALVELYGCVEFYQPDRTPVASATTPGDGGFIFGDLSPGWYIAEGSAGGYLNGRTTAFEVRQGGTVSRQIVLSQPGQSLARLLPQMDGLRENVAETMLFETDLMAALTGQAVDDLGISGDTLIWKSVSVLGDVINPAGPSLKFLTGLAVGAVEDAVAAGTGALAPHTGLREWTSEEIRSDIAAWQEGEDRLATSHATFADDAASTTVSTAFDMDRAVRMISDQGKAVEEIRRGLTPSVLPLADPNDEYIGISLPGASLTYASASAAIGRIGSIKKLATTLQAVSGGAALVLSLTGVGAGVAGTIYAGATVTKTVTGHAEFAAKEVGGVAYYSCARGWGLDVNSLPGVYISTADLLRQEAVTPAYLNSANTYSAQASMHIHPDQSSPGRMLFSVVAPFTFREATINVQNTGNTPSRIRVRANGVWMHKVSTGLPIIGDFFGCFRIVNTPTCGAYRDIPLPAGGTETVGVPFGIAAVDPTDILSAHYLEVDVYSGPFLCKTMLDTFFLLFNRPLPQMDDSDGQVKAWDMAPSAGFKKDGGRLVLAGDDLLAMLPVTSTVIEGAVSPSNTLLRQTYTVGDGSWSVEFSLFADAAAEVALQIEDADGFVVGYVPAKGGNVQEFVAEYSGLDANPQIVDIPDATGQTYTVKAVLLASDTDGPFDVQVIASEVPVRPAVLAITPSAYSVTTHAGRDVTVPVAFGEAGHQQPLTETVVTSAALVHANGIDELPLGKSSGISFGTVKAGASENAQFTWTVPPEAPYGRYAGEIVVDSPSTGPQAMDVSVFVLLPGDANGDCKVNLLDLLFIRDRIGAGAGTADNWKADVNLDGKINLLDLLYVRDRVGSVCQ